MNITKLAITTAALAGAALLYTPFLSAQDAPPPPPPDGAAPPALGGSSAPGGPPDNGGRGNMQDFLQRMNDRIKTELKVSDDEWSVIQPLLEKVQLAQRASFAGRMGGFGRRGGGGGGGNGGGPGGPGGNRPSSPESDALKTALDSDSTSATDIKTKLQALRDARKKSEADLAQARTDLRKVLTLRQEATLVLMGILD